MKMIHLNTQDIKSQVLDLVQQIYDSDWRPDYIVGITRGGLTPATMLSHYLKINMYTLDVRLRDGGDPETNMQMATDAVGIDISSFTYEEVIDPRNILIVDDINDSGATFNWIKQDWENAGIPSRVPRRRLTWESVWGSNVRFASLVNNEGSSFKNISYSSLIINKTESPSWIVFPWENWWSDKNW
jgi:xanthine phosphoribosyltransferase